jgi:hypothetical protein
VIPFLDALFRKRRPEVYVHESRAPITLDAAHLTRAWKRRWGRFETLPGERVFRPLTKKEAA